MLCGSELQQPVGLSVAQFKCNEINICNLVFSLFDRFPIRLFFISNSILSWQSMDACFFLLQWHHCDWNCRSGFTFYPDQHVSIPRISLVHDQRRWLIMVISSGGTTLVTHSVLTEMPWRQRDNKWFANSCPIGMNCCFWGSLHFSNHHQLNNVSSTLVSDQMLQLLVSEIRDTVMQTCEIWPC